MAAPNVFASNRQFIGIAKETSSQTPLAMTATLEVTAFDAVDKTIDLADEALRGSMVDEYDVIQGPIYSEISFSGPAYVDTLPHLIRNILGDYTGTGASAPFSHAISTLNSGTGQPVTHTLTDFDGIAAGQGARWYASTVLTELNFKWNAESELFTYDAKGLAFPSAIPGVTPTPSPSVIRAQPSWQMAVGIGGPASGGTQVKSVVEGGVSIKRAATVRWTSQAAQTPYIIGRGKVGVDGTLRLIAADESPLLAMLANTIQPVQFLLNSGAQQQVQIDMAQFNYRDAPRDHSKELIEWNTQFKAEANTVNAGASGGYSPAKVTVVNAVNITTY